MFLLSFTCGTLAKKSKKKREQGKTKTQHNPLLTDCLEQSDGSKFRKKMFKIKNKKHYSQLRLVGVWARVGHAEDPTARVGQVGSKLILERFSPKRLSSCGRRRWRTGRERERKKEKCFISLLLQLIEEPDATVSSEQHVSSLQSADMKVFLQLQT